MLLLNRDLDGFTDGFVAMDPLQVHRLPVGRIGDADQLATRASRFVSGRWHGRSLPQSVYSVNGVITSKAYILFPALPTSNTVYAVYARVHAERRVSITPNDSRKSSLLRARPAELSTLSEMRLAVSFKIGRDVVTADVVEAMVRVFVASGTDVLSAIVENEVSAEALGEAIRGLPMCRQSQSDLGGVYTHGASSAAGATPGRADPEAGEWRKAAPRKGAGKLKKITTHASLPAPPAKKRGGSGGPKPGGPHKAG